jgi:hypothetical protein
LLLPFLFSFFDYSLILIVVNADSSEQILISRTWNNSMMKTSSFPLLLNILLLLVVITEHLLLLIEIILVINNMAFIFVNEIIIKLWTFLVGYYIIDVICIVAVIKLSLH